MLELIPKASGRPTLGLVQLELVLLMQAALPDLPAVFPSHDGAVHATPPSGATADESLTWYALQQSLLCCLQVCPFVFSWMTLCGWQLEPERLFHAQAQFETERRVMERLSPMLQALSDLMALPVPLSQHVQLKLGKVTGSQAIGLLQPGHCIWHVKRLSRQAPQIPLEALDISAPLSPVEYVLLLLTSCACFNDC